MDRDAALKDLENRLNKAIRQIDDLAYRADTLEDDERIIYDDHVQPLRRQEESLRQRVLALESSHAADWERLRTEAERFVAEFQKEVEKAVFRLRDIA